jgi:hypothetical protein
LYSLFKHRLAQDLMMVLCIISVSSECTHMQVQLGRDDQGREI